MKHVKARTKAEAEERIGRDWFKMVRYAGEYIGFDTREEYHKWERDIGMRFTLRDRNHEAVMGTNNYPLSYDNAYIAAYGTVREGCKHPHDLVYGETTYKTYALSGQTPPEYSITRVK